MEVTLSKFLENKEPDDFQVSLLLCNVQLSSRSILLRSNYSNRHPALWCFMQGIKTAIGGTFSPMGCDICVCVCHFMPFLFINSIEFPMFLCIMSTSLGKRKTSHEPLVVLLHLGPAAGCHQVSAEPSPEPFPESVPILRFSIHWSNMCFFGQHRWTMVGSRNKRGEAGSTASIWLPGSFIPNLQLLQISASLTLCHFMSTSNDKFEVTQKWNHVTSTNHSNYTPPQVGQHNFNWFHVCVSKGWKFDLCASLPDWFGQWRHILQKVYPMLVVKQWLAFPTILPEIKSEKNNVTWLLHRKNHQHSSWVFSGDMRISPGHCKPMGTVTVFKTCTACITASWKHKKFWPLPLMIWVHPPTWDAWSSNNNGIKDHILYVTDVWSITA